MRSRTAGLLGCGLTALVLGCQPEASDRQGNLALAGVALGTQPQAARRNAQEQLVVRRLWEGPEPDFWGASVSPDGRYKSEIDWASGGRLAVIDLLTGELKQVADTGWTGSDYAEMSVFSPDGRRLAYTYWSEATQGYEIRTIGVDGSGRRTILPNPGRGFYAEVKEWSKDGLFILALLWDDGSRPPMRIGLISVADGSIRTLKEYQEWVISLDCALSRDGRFVAYDLSTYERADHDIYLLPVDGGRETALLDGPADDRLLGWTPDGSGVLFYSDRGLTKGIWMLRVSNGRATGEPMLLRGDVWGLEPIGFSRDAYYYGITTQQGQVHTAIIDPQEWKLVTPPAAIEDPSLGFSKSVAWSPDGRYLAYIRRSSGPRYWTLVIRSVTGENSREIALSSIQPVGLIRWTDDNRAVIMFARDASAIGLLKLDLDTGTAAMLWQPAAAAWPLLATIQLSPDLKTAYFARLGETPGTTRILARDLASGRERELGKVASIPTLALSPDGRSLAFTERDSARSPSRIAMIPTAGGGVQQVYRAAKPEEPRSPRWLAWSSDGRYLLFADKDAQANRYSLWRVPVAGGEPDRLELPLGDPPGLSYLRFHPRNTRIAFTSTAWRGEVWVAEKLPGTK